MDMPNHEKCCQDIDAKAVLQEFEEYIQGGLAADAGCMDSDIVDLFISLSTDATLRFFLKQVDDNTCMTFLCP